MEEAIKTKIDELIKENRIMLFMKGRKEQPMCGFSAQVVQLLGKHNVEYEAFDVLSDWALREGIKEHSEWPTIPQLYVDGQFIGGCDIIMELDRKGELAKTISK